ncbi:hypothetical protein LTR20_002831 [Exophiala xenobiotica]|nr:hypothetical protein LTR40_007320 [Exophiala xenobiotica]KAK5390447.1 hypothetical protein LTS13_000529 [Exophiala xenobiotica]KAK5403665.1 hypothetical protein LTR79_000419 [Exophiala xenobiotica]KAK5414642.1 hypothetical protein LTR06_004456 [Exophiala xenobiotica]KAK5423154.1 hypothetical protein LTR90_002173 [Exophiala xenobiotica]
MQPLPRKKGRKKHEDRNGIVETESFLPDAASIANDLCPPISTTQSQISTTSAGPRNAIQGGCQDVSQSSPAQLITGPGRNSCSKEQDYSSHSGTVTTQSEASSIRRRRGPRASGSLDAPVRDLENKLSDNAIEFPYQPSLRLDQTNLGGNLFQSATAVVLSFWPVRITLKLFLHSIAIILLLGMFIGLVVAGILAIISLGSEGRSQNHAEIRFRMPHRKHGERRSHALHGSVDQAHAIAQSLPEEAESLFSWAAEFLTLELELNKVANSILLTDIRGKEELAGKYDAYGEQALHLGRDLSDYYGDIMVYFEALSLNMEYFGRVIGERSTPFGIVLSWFDRTSLLDHFNHYLDFVEQVTDNLTRKADSCRNQVRQFGETGGTIQVAHNIRLKELGGSDRGFWDWLPTLLQSRRHTQSMQDRITLVEVGRTYHEPVYDGIARIIEIIEDTRAHVHAARRIARGESRWQPWHNASALLETINQHVNSLHKLSSRMADAGQLLSFRSQS